MWFRGAERWLLFTAGQTNRISNSGTLSWEGHGSDPIITTDLGPWGGKGGCVFFFFPRAYMVEAAGPLSTSLAACLSTTGPSPLICRGQGNGVSSLLFLAFLFHSLYLILPIRMQQGAAGVLLGYLTSCAANDSLATSGLYANWTGDPTVPTPNPHHHRRHHLFSTTLTLCNLGNLGAKRMLLGKRKEKKKKVLMCFVIVNIQLFPNFVMLKSWIFIFIFDN